MNSRDQQATCDLKVIDGDFSVTIPEPLAKRFYNFEIMTDLLVLVRKR